MQQRAKPSVLIIDDKPDEVRALENELSRQASARVIHPADATREDLSGADLVVVDLVLENWIQNHLRLPLANRPRDGLALAAVLRSHVTERKHPPAKAFALLSGRLDEVSPALPPELREHALARLNNLEWVFQKADAADLPGRILSLAQAVQDLPKTWPVRKREALMRLMALDPDAPWTERAWQDVEDCHPPVHELAAQSHGLVLLRWLLHRILPYPCFLWDTVGLAARLRVSYRSLKVELGRNAKLRRALSEFEFKGLLCGFLGHRWWRSGGESFVWEITDGRPFDAETVRAALIRRTRARLEQLQDPHPIVCLDADLRPMETFYTSEQAIRIQPDDWPPYADQAWTTIELARQYSALKTLVIEQDRGRL